MEIIQFSFTGTIKVQKNSKNFQLDAWEKKHDIEEETILWNTSLLW